MAFVFIIKLTLASGISEHIDQVFTDYSHARKTALDIRRQNNFFSLKEQEPDLWTDGNTKVQIFAMNLAEAEKIEYLNQKGGFKANKRQATKKNISAKSIIYK